MKKQTLLVLASLLLLAMLMPGLALAQSPTGDFAIVQQRAADWLASGPKPVMTANMLFDNLNDGDTGNDPLVLSVRKPDDFAKGHIPGASNIVWNQIAKPENLATLSKDLPIVDYCYTGHTGQVAMTALNLMGYDAVNLKFGIMGWTKNDAVYAQVRFDPATVPDYRVETTINEPTETYPFPELNTGASDPDEVVRIALDNYLSSGKAPVMAASALFDNLNDGDTSNDPVIVSVRSPEHYAIGHIPGAINIPWTQIADPANLAKLPPDKPIVVYCYTGHTGQLATTILNALGYDATNLKYGMMGWSADPDVVATSVFDPATQPDFRIEGTMADAQPTAMETAVTAAPAELPTTGGNAANLTWLVVLFGSGLVSAGAMLRRQ